MANIITARELYKMLIFDCRIKSLGGLMKFQLGDVGITVKRRDIIGDVMQLWVEEWLKRSRIDFMPNPQ
ncbi:MAG: NgoBV family restriction endonuclease, partial [Synergistaceae bacterium]|nr:NgoBV family restriction endonuclease [Synergistaceae bacterium]